MAPPLRLDATLGFLRSGLRFGQVVAAAVLLGLVVLGDPSGVDWAADRPHATGVAVVGGVLVACALLRTLASALLLTTRGFPRAHRGRAAVGVRLVEALVACATTALAGLATLDAVVAGEFETFAVAVGTSRFDAFVLVLACVVVAHAAGSVAFGRVRRAE